MLRPYQTECVDATLASFRENRSVLAVLATGLGKTVIGANVIKRLMAEGGKRVLWLAHREELLEQAASAIRYWAACEVGVEAAANYASHYGFAVPPVVVGSVATLRRQRRLRRFDPAAFGLIVTDEAHHAVASSYRTIYDYFHEGIDGEIAGNPDIRHLGITATPKRADKLAMGKVFDTVAYEYGIEAAVGDGWLVPVKQAMVVVGPLHLENVKVVAGDYTAADLEAELTRDEVLHQMVSPSVKLIGDSQALFFCAGVLQAREVCRVLNNYNPGSASFVDGKTENEERRATVAAFRERRLQYLCNCGVFLEGFDAPAVSYVVMARPTKSLSLYVQMLGRGTRPLPGVVDGIDNAAMRKAAIAASRKPCCTVIDFVGNAQQHGQNAAVCAADVLGGKYSEETKTYARRTLEDEDGPRAIEEALDRADAEIALLREEEERRARIVARVDYRVDYVSEMNGARREQRSQRYGEPATEKQIWKLVSLGVPRHKAERVTKQQARGWISRLLEETR